MKFKYIAMLMTAAFIWGSGFVMTRVALDNGYSAFYISGMRFIIASAILAVILRKDIPLISKETYIKGSLLGTLLFFAFSFQTIGLIYTTISRNAFITAVSVVILPFMVWIAYRKRPRPAQFIAAGITLVGVRLLGRNLDGAANIGDFLTLLCAFFFAWHILLLGVYTQNHSPMVLAGLQLLVAGILSWVCVFAFERMPEFSLYGMLALLYQGVFSSFVAYSFQNIGQKHLSQITTAVVISLESVFGTFFSVVVYKERLSTTMIVGAILIFVAILLAEINFTRNAKTRTHS